MAVAALGRPSGCGGWARQCDLWTSGRGPSAALMDLKVPIKRPDRAAAAAAALTQNEKEEGQK